jgi:hypothetical protein
MVLGIVGLATSIFCCGACMVGLICSIVAWVLGHQELKAIESGTSDLAGQGNARAGMIMGIIGTVINALILVGVALYYIFIFAVVIAGGAASGGGP